MTDLKHDKFCPCVNWEHEDAPMRQAFREHRPDCDGHGNRLHVAINTGQSYIATTGMDISRDGWTGAKTTELQLLVIDLGDCCVVKVEKGDKKAVCKAVMGAHCICEHGNTTVTGRDFEHVKESIDALDGDKPVPRIEKHENGYTVFRNPVDKPYTFEVPFEVEWVIRELGGALPIYEGGKWERVGDANTSWCPVAIWRYTR